MKNNGLTLQDRLARAAQAKQAAIEKLRAKPPVDPAVLAERQAAHLKREEAAAEKRAAREAARQEAKEAELAKQAAIVAPPTEAELKAARDARYAARKKRK